MWDRKLEMVGIVVDVCVVVIVWLVDVGDMGLVLGLNLTCEAHDGWKWA